MVDPLDVQQVERLGHRCGPALLARVSDPVESQFTGAGVHALELGGRVADLGRVQTDPDDRRTGLLQIGQHRQGLLLGAVPVEAGDQLDGRAVVAFGGRDARRQPVQHPLERDAAGDVGLRVEERFDVAYAAGGRPGDIGGHQVAEVFLGLQHGEVRVEQVQEALQVGELVSTAQVLQVGVGQLDLVAAGQFQHRLRLQGAFEMEVQLDLGKGAQIAHRGPLWTLPVTVR